MLRARVGATVGGYPGSLPPPYYALPVPPWVHHTPYHPGYTTPCTTPGTRLVVPAPWLTARRRAGEGALGSVREYILGGEVFCASERRKCVPSYASARRILCSLRAETNNDRIANGGNQGAGPIGTLLGRIRHSVLTVPWIRHQLSTSLRARQGRPMVHDHGPFGQLLKGIGHPGRG